MQEEPKKTVGSYNEFVGKPEVVDKANSAEAFDYSKYTPEQQAMIKDGLSLVHQKITKLLGYYGDELIRTKLHMPNIRFIPDDPSIPDCTGLFRPNENEILILTDRIGNDHAETMEVFVHEYVHFLAHNGHDDNELKDGNITEISKRNNIGFNRHGIDIRKGREGQATNDYFLSFNEAVTEQLTIDLFPDRPDTEVYIEYRGLLNQVIEDAVAQGYAPENAVGYRVKPWTHDQVKDFIYRCFFKGDLNGFTNFLSSVYKAYSISEQQFGLMTSKYDLPSVISMGISPDAPAGPDTPPKSPGLANHFADAPVTPDDSPHTPGSPPHKPRGPLPPSYIAAKVQERLDNKTPDDYITDVIINKPGPSGVDSDSAVDKKDETDYGSEYDGIISSYGVSPTDEKLEGIDFQTDNGGFIIYRGDTAKMLFDSIKDELHAQIARYIAGDKISIQEIYDNMDKMLFEENRISMISEGFRDFYIYKHEKLDKLKK